MIEHRLAIVSAATAALVLLAGGTINPHQAGLACPEALFLCHGSLFPALTGKVLFEHGHRLLAMSIGLLQIGLTVLLWRRRPALRRVAIAGLALVCAQGMLGALTVRVGLSWQTSTGHLVLGCLYLAMLIYVAWQTRRVVRPGSNEATPPVADPGRARLAILVAGMAVLAQIVLGGLVRHVGAFLASVDWPLHQGSLWPAGPLELKLHMAHRIAGVVVGSIAIACAVVVFRAAGQWRALRMLALAVPALVSAQIAMGLWVIASLRAPPVAVAHFAGAIALWSLFVAMWWMTGVPRTAALPRRELHAGVFEVA
jgi:heme a synthase